jgi:calcineurin-like phosphoesterase family protein
VTIWVFSDPHFGHENMLTFTGTDGQLVRPGFKNAAEVDECILDRTNAVVRPSDHVYCLGDVAIKKQYLSLVRRINGKKRLVMGNHDIFDIKLYLAAGFQKVMGYRVLANMILSHVPVHPSSLGRFGGNVHGHIHERPSPPGKYLNVCVEQLNYTPITVEDAAVRLAAKEAA